MNSDCDRCFTGAVKATLPPLFLTLLMVVSTFAGTTGLLEGRVTDKATGQYVVGANVTVVGTQFGAAADVDGIFVIANIRAGTYSVKFSSVGYRTVILQNVTILPDLRTRIDMQLDPSAVELDAIEVRAERPLIQKDQPSTAFSIGEVKLDKLPVVAFQEVLGLQPGTTVEGNVRGGKINEVVYLVDGLPVQDVVGGGLGTGLPKSSITGMTVHTGGFEAQYGNAMSGIVNVVTKTGADKHEIGGRVERDGWLPTRVNEQQDRLTEVELTAGGPIVQNRLFYFTANTYTQSDTRWWRDFDQFRVDGVISEFNGFSKLESIISPSVRLALQGIYSLRDWRDYEFTWRFNLPGLPARNRNSYRLALTLSHTLSDNVFYTASVSRYFQRSEIGERIGADQDLRPYEYDFFLRYIVGGKRHWWADTRQTIYTVKGDVTAQIDRSHIVKAGVELHQYNILSDLIKFEPQLTYFGKPIETADLLNYSNSYHYQPRSGSVYVQDKIEFVRDGSSFSFGVRWDFLDTRAARPIVEFIPVRQDEFEQRVVGSTKVKFKHQFSPRIAFAAPVGPSSFFYVNFGQYFQYPLFDYLYSGINPSQIRSGTRGVLTGNPDLEPERTIAWEAGFKHGISPTVVASATYFRKSISNQIDSKTLIPFDSKSAGDYGFASYVNNAQATVNGLEFVISQERGEKFSGTISYSYMVTEGVSDNVNQSINLAQWGFPLVARPYPLSWDQRHTIKADADFSLFLGMQMNVVVLYNSPRPYTFYPTRDGYTPLDSTKAFLPNNARMEDVLFINFKVRREFTLGCEPNFYYLTLYADARNVLNAKNIRWVDSNGRVGGELGDPGAYYDPRRIRVGARLEF
ncbi:MAG: TonB-dependent receptor [Bacteroidetes bacterium]|nr:TonB-dependent receptor [Bacteroidota bacterium]MCW5896369.1 TonB-dependent receptor [Bacteroidota bacterium]